MITLRGKQNYANVCHITENSDFYEDITNVKL